MSGTVTAPGNGTFDWVLPVAESPGSNPKTDIADASGFTTFQWRPQDDVGPSGFSLSETIEPGFQNDPALSLTALMEPPMIGLMEPLRRGSQGSRTGAIVRRF